MGVEYQKGLDGVAWVTLNRPEVLNALDSGTKQELASIWTDVASDDSVRAVVLSGNGPKAFCAGSDMKEMDQSGQTVTTDLLVRSLPGAQTALDKPVIAALHGYCIGMGLTLALHCDLRLADQGTVLGFPEVRHGMISGVSAVRLPQMVPTCRALELLLLGNTISALEAERFGLINRVIEGNVREEAGRWAQILACHSPVAVRATKRLARLGLQRLLEDEQSEIDQARVQVEKSEDFKEGARAFAEHRVPSFIGR